MPSDETRSVAQSTGSIDLPSLSVAVPFLYLGSAFSPLLAFLSERRSSKLRGPRGTRCPNPVVPATLLSVLDRTINSKPFPYFEKLRLEAQSAAVTFVADNPGLIPHCHMHLHVDFGFMQLLEYAG